MCNLGWPAAIALFAAGAPRPLLVALFVLSGVGLSLFDVWWQTALAQRIPPHALSRVSSLRLDGLAGAAAARLPARRPDRPRRSAPAEVLIVGGLVGLAISALGFAIPDVWRLRKLSSAG